MSELHLPVEPLFPPEVACEMIPCSRRQLDRLMVEAQLPRLYRHEAGGRRHRVVPASFIKWARNEMVRPRSKRPHRAYVPEPADGRLGS